MAQKRLIWFWLASLTAACGDDSSDTGRLDEQQGDGDDHGSNSDVSGPCDTRHCYASALYTCFEWGVDDDEHVRLCGQMGGEVSAGACPDENKVAGCKATSPFSGEGCTVNWGYAPALTESDVSEDCDERGGSLTR